MNQNFYYFCYEGNKMKDFARYIAINQAIRFGKPCIKGTRISVADILQWLASGMSYEEILIDYPELKIEQIRAALAYAAHREQ
jgi:uncharacterized protein (DUF433 family)